jgi:hypothetical protein
METSVYCGSYESFEVLEFHTTCGWWQRFRKNAGGGRQWRDLVCKGSEVLNVIFVFVRDLCTNSLVKHLPSGSIQSLYVVWYVYGISEVIQVRFIKKKYR